MHKCNVCFVVPPDAQACFFSSSHIGVLSNSPIGSDLQSNMKFIDAFIHHICHLCVGDEHKRVQ